MFSEKIISHQFAGEQFTLDLEIDSKFHNFYANDICVSNSHAVSYSYLAMQTLYLKHYYPTEFYTALMNHPKGNQKKEEKIRWLSSCISAAISKGIKIMPPSRKSKWDWSMTGDKEISMGFSGINGLGDAAYRELVDLIDKSGKSLDKIGIAEFFELPFSEYDKRSFINSVKAGVFDDWSNSRQFLMALREKKRPKKVANQLAMFDMKDVDDDINKIENKTHPVSTEVEKTIDFLEVCNFDLSKIERFTRIKTALNKETKFPVDNIMNFEEGGSWYFFIVDKLEVLMTKNGKQYLNTKIGDGVNHVSVKAFGSEMPRMQKELQKDCIYITKFEKTASGFLNYVRNAPIKKFEYKEN